jgi:porin
VARAVAAPASPESDPPGDRHSIGYKRPSRLGSGANDVAAQLHRDDQPKDALLPGFEGFLGPYYALKARAYGEVGLRFGLGWTVLYQAAGETLAGNADDAVGSILQLNAAWTPIGRGTPNAGTLGFRLEARDRLGGGATPNGLGGEIGSLWSTATGYSDFGLSLLNLWWQQQLLDGRLAVRAGKLVPFAVHDAASLKNYHAGFTNAAFSINPTIPFPATALGAVAAVHPTDETYLAAGVYDADGEPEELGSFSERLVIGDLGWKPELSFGKGHYHVTAWYAPTIKDEPRANGWGVNVYGEQRVGRWLPFLRYGYADGGATAVEHLVSVGLGIHELFGQRDDVVGVGLSWGAPRDPELRSQGAGELFYRVQLTPSIAVTPSVQLIAHPSANPAEDWIGLLALRARIAF